MNKKSMFVAIIVLVVAVVGVLLVLPSREEKAQAQYDAAFKIEKSGEYNQAITLYQALRKEYEDTEAASAALDAIGRVERLKDQALIKEARGGFNSVSLVMEGYKSMKGELPTSIAQLDAGDYLFDSDYLAEIVPEGITYTLRFNKGEMTEKYSLYIYKSGGEKAVIFTPSGEAKAISVDSYNGELKKAGFEKTEKRNMVFLQPG